MTIVDTLIDNLPLLIDAAITLVMALTGGLVDALPELIPAVIAMIIMLTTELIKRIPEILEFVPVLFKNLGEAFKEIDWATLGSDLVKGIWDGIVNIGDWFKGKISGFVDGIKNLFTRKEGFDMHSPSKVMVGFGLNIVQGLANGVTDNASIAINAITTLVGQMTNVARNAVASITGILSTGQMGQLTKDIQAIQDKEDEKNRKEIEKRTRR